jgi:hypothetical protein
MVNGRHHATTYGIFQENFTEKLRERYFQMNSMELSRSV